ncbi:M81 family metallopeptidase [Chitinophaga sp.]|uniref:M81 family metallopeptidase n=1 Tax=Chitinophaga sp. TaxID=1869181 RepID=UPI0031D306CB
MKKRIALLGIYHETNTFIATPTTLGDFRSGYWLAGEGILQEYAGAHHEISGIIEAIGTCGDMELVPVLYTMATPGGIIVKEAYETMVYEMMRMLDEVLPVDGCIVVPHGAGVAEGYPDMDGHWLGLLREKLGAHIPVTGTLDPHANVSPAMAAATDALVAYATNPHTDQRATGRKAALLMIDTLRGKIRPVQQLVQLPLAISIEQQYTDRSPCKELYAFAEQVKTENSLLSLSVLLGFPYADVPEMGTAFLLVADGAHTNAAEALRSYIRERKTDFNGQKQNIETVIPLLKDMPAPVLLLDMGDNVGGGAPGNSTLLLEAMEKAGLGPGFICIHDPAAVEVCRRFSTGSRFALTTGHYNTEATLLQLADGRFVETTPKHGGFVNYDMGPVAVIKTHAGNTVMFTTRRTPPYSLRQMTAFNLGPADFAWVAAKGVNAPIAAYAGVCPSIVQVDTPGVTGADMTLFNYRCRRRPMFPFEENI